MTTRIGSRACKHLAVAAALCALALLATAPAAAQQPTSKGSEEAALRVAKGRVTFKVYCSNCHGETGVGNGKLAELLKVPPSDLTRLSAKNGGKFPMDEVVASIDGREDVRGHGEREMPVWGEAFLKTLQVTYSEKSDEERVQDKVLDVAAFIESIQVRE